MTSPVDIVAAAVSAADVPTFAPRRISQGYSWAEIPRWHDGKFWFSDMYTSTLKTLDEDGKATVVVDASSRAANTDVHIHLGGFGWLPDGRLIVNSMHEQLVLVHNGGDPDDLAVYADLSQFAIKAINDMVVDSDGRAYITQLGFNIFEGEEPIVSDLIVVEPDATVHAPDVPPLNCGNGIAISADGTEVYVAEVMAQKITVIDRALDGSLSNSREFAALPFLPDGICLDEDGGVWAALPGAGHIARFTESGVTDAVPLPLEDGIGSACILGGPDRSTLYITAGYEVFDFDKSVREALGGIWVADVKYRGGQTRP